MLSFSIPKGLTREHVLRALADLDAGVGHHFGSPTGYELVHGGRRYPPKAVVGLAVITLSEPTLVSRLLGRLRVRSHLQHDGRRPFADEVVLVGADKDQVIRLRIGYQPHTRLGGNNIRLGRWALL